MKDTKIMIWVSKTLTYWQCWTSAKLDFQRVTFVHMNPEYKVFSPYKQTKSTGYWSPSGFTEITEFLKAK